MEKPDYLLCRRLCAASGHAAALPSPAMNSRRRISIPRADRGSLSRGRLQGNGVARPSGGASEAPYMRHSGPGAAGVEERPLYGLPACVY
jgi:hypothetical protein